MLGKRNRTGSGKQGATAFTGAISTTAAILQALRADFQKSMDANPKLRHFIVERPNWAPMLPDIWQQIVDASTSNPFTKGKKGSGWFAWYQFEDHSVVAYRFGPKDELQTFERLAASAWTALPECVANRPLFPMLEDVVSRHWAVPPECTTTQPDIAFALEQKTWPTLYLDPPDKKAPPSARSERWMWFVYWLLRGQSGSYLSEVQHGQHRITELMVDPFTASRFALDLLLADAALDWDAESRHSPEQRQPVSRPADVVQSGVTGGVWPYSFRAQRRARRMFPTSLVGRPSGWR
jgi:hypothetical protein